MIEIRPGLELPDSAIEYRTSRSGGPGGQHVNKTESRVELRLHVGSCDTLSERVQDRLRSLAGSRLTLDDVLRIVCGRNRSQRDNRAECEQRLRELVLDALKPPPPPRKKTKPSRRQKAKRLTAKRRRGEIKAGRRRGGGDD